MAEYRLGRRNAECAATGEPFGEGEEIVSAIFEGDEGFERRDYKASAFTGDEGAFSFWRAHIPVKQQDAQRLDYDLALEFFRKLVAENDPERAGLRFVLALLLGRKRRLKLKGFRKRGDGEVLHVVLRGDEEDEELTVDVPALDDSGRGALQAELNRLFGIETPDEPDAGPADAEQSGESEPADAGS
jgi:hypothetical protein